MSEACACTMLRQDEKPQSRVAAQSRDRGNAKHFRGPGEDSKNREVRVSAAGPAASAGPGEDSKNREVRASVAGPAASAGPGEDSKNREVLASPGGPGVRLRRLAGPDDGRRGSLHFQRFERLSQTLHINN